MKIKTFFYHFKQIFLIVFSIVAIIIVLDTWSKVPNSAIGWIDEFSKDQIMWYVKFTILFSTILFFTSIIRYIKYFKNNK